MSRHSTWSLLDDSLRSLVRTYLAALDPAASLQLGRESMVHWSCIRLCSAELSRCATSVVTSDESWPTLSRTGGPARPARCVLRFLYPIEYLLSVSQVAYVKVSRIVVLGHKDLGFFPRCER